MVQVEDGEEGLQEAGWSPGMLPEGRMVPRDAETSPGSPPSASQHISSFLRIRGQIPGL